MHKTYTSNKRQDEILDELKRRAKEVRFGMIIVEFKVHEEVIIAGEIVEQKIKLG